MDNIFRGEPISKEGFIDKLDELKQRIREDLMGKQLMPELVIEAVHTLAGEINKEEISKQLAAMGIPKWTSEEYIKVSVESLKRESLQMKLKAELGEEPFTWKKVNQEVSEKGFPLGVIVHIGAGNTLGLSAFSVIEGLLTGNINILKLPENEGGISSKLLLRMIEIEPRLKPYIYVLDVSSKNREVISRLIEEANAVTIWGSDEAIKAIRQLVPPSLPIIEWGHRLSFAYFTKSEKEEEDLKGLARAICMTDQLYCSSPQCVFYEACDASELDDFADRLARHIEAEAIKYPSADRPINIQSQITWAYELVRAEEVLREKRLITDEKRRYGVMVDYKTELKASPLFRSIWVMPVKREELFALLRKHKGYLQTAGLSCGSIDFEELSGILYAAGINRITSCESMSVNYAGEPHDGVYALGRYIRKVNKRL